MLPNADYLLKLMRQQTEKIGKVLAEDEKPRKFLNWANEKAELSEVVHQYIARFFYFSLDPILELDFPSSLDSRFILEGKVELDRALTSATDRYNRIFRLQNNFHFISLDNDIDFDLYCALGCVQNPQLNAQLKALRADLPIEHFGTQTTLKKYVDLEEKANFNQWWQTDGQVWTERLKAVMVEHCNIGHDWQFTDEQKELLQQYYEANLLLVDCLNSAHYVSREVRQEIEETLLLPIAEIEAWKQNKGRS